MATGRPVSQERLAKRALVIGAETATRILDWNDRTDLRAVRRWRRRRGAGAGQGRRASAAFSPRALRSDGHSLEQALYRWRAVLDRIRWAIVRMEGKEVFKHAVGMITDVVYKVLEDTGHTIEDLDWFVPHQANNRIIDGAGASSACRPKRWWSRSTAMPTRRPPRCRWRSHDRPCRWPHQARRPGDDRGDGRRLHLGRFADPLVKAISRSFRLSLRSSRCAGCRAARSRSVSSTCAPAFDVEIGTGQSHNAPPKEKTPSCLAAITTREVARPERKSRDGSSIWLHTL